MDKTQPHPLFKLATELGPLVVFFVANAKFDLFVATGAVSYTHLTLPTNREV